MELNPTQQAFRLIDQSKKILIITAPYSPATSPANQLDHIAGALALAKALETNESKITVITPQIDINNFAYLPNINKIKPKLKTKKDLIISLKLKDKDSVAKVKHQIKDHKLKIRIIPKTRTIIGPEIRTSEGQPSFDLIITVGLPDLELLGKTFENNSETFYELPIINIDHRATNEYFGEVNLVEVTASSTSEIIFELLNKIKNQNLDENTATYLLGGIMAATKSFRSPATTPKTFQIAAELAALGADKELIVENIYKTRGFGLLKLWGRALARIKEDSKHNIIWTLLTVADFEKSEADTSLIANVFAEVKNMTPNSEFVVLLAETKPKQITALVSTTKNNNPQELLGSEIQVQEVGTRYEATIDFKNIELLDAEQELISKLQRKETNDLTVDN